MSIFLDFDGTITAEDTIGELASFALNAHHHHQQQQQQQQPGSNSAGSSSSSSSSSSDLSSAWDAVVRAYAADHRAGAAAHHAPAPARVSPPQEIEFLRALKGVEERSLARVRRCGLFRGVGGPRGAAFRDAGEALVRTGAVRLRPGFREFVERRTAAAAAAAAQGAGEGGEGGEGGWRVCVISVNWSAAFIRGACASCPGVRVIANDVRDEDGAVVGPEILGGGGDGGGERRALTNSQDKLDVMRAVLREQGEGGSLADTPSVYVGDSTTDLECLLAADRGIVMADTPDSPLLETLRRIGKEVPHVSERRGDAGSSGSSNISWASNFEEINEHVTFEWSSAT